jgi:signal transduction histidine kinase
VSRIVVNLVENAFLHAFTPERPGRIRVTGQALPGGGAVLGIEDDGAGMTAGVLKQAFEPYFTTRQGQGGIGLGLALVKELIEGPLRGEIQVVSEPGHGTRFELRLPNLAAQG